jgi:hypothetical protein
MNKFSLLPMSTLLAGVNSNDAFVPEHWANESVAILEENMVVANLVHRDFENLFAQSGDIVNTRKPGEFTAKRKGMNTDVTVQDATATNIPVKLNQHVHVSFLIRDREQALSFKDLVATYLQPAVLAIGRHVDKMVLAQAPRFLRTDQYQPGSLGVDASVASILSTRQKMNDDKCPPSNRNMILSSKDETALLNLDIFTNAEKVGDSGTALREASLGRRLGFNMYMCQNVCSVTGTSDTVTGAVNNSAGYAAGIASMTVNGLSAAIVAGTWFKVAGDNIPHRVVSTTGGATPTAIVFLPALKSAVVHTAVITIYDPGAVNQDVAGDGGVTSGYAATGYEAGWEDYIVVDAFTALPQVGQFVQFAAAGAVYTVIDVVTASNKILLDRPLDANLADDAVVLIGPNGTYNFAFVRNAISLVVRPMAVPRSGSGATGAVANYRGLAVRVVWAYDANKQGLLVTVDMLCGIAVLDTLLGQVMLG